MKPFNYSSSGGHHQTTRCIEAEKRGRANIFWFINVNNPTQYLHPSISLMMTPPRFDFMTLVCTSITLLVLCGCYDNTPSHTTNRPVVAVSIVPQAWLVTQIAGDRVDVLTLTNPGDSPAVYQPTDAQVSRLMSSAVYFRIGVPFERGRWFEAIQAAGHPPIIDTRNGITLKQMPAHTDRHEEHNHTHNHNHAGADPHIWLCPRLLKRQARTITDSLSKFDPAHADEYARNFRSLETRLDELDATIRAKLEPIKGKAVFVFHPAWGYFADEYGFRQIPIQLQGKDPSDHELTQLQQLARHEGVKVIFVQPQITSRAAQAVAHAIGGRVEQIDPLAPDAVANLFYVASAIAKSYE